MTVSKFQLPVEFTLTVVKCVWLGACMAVLLGFVVALSSTAIGIKMLEGDWVS